MCGQHASSSARVQEAGHAATVVRCRPLADPQIRESARLASGKLFGQASLEFRGDWSVHYGWLRAVGMRVQVQCLNHQPATAVRANVQLRAREHTIDAPRQRVRIPQQAQGRRADGAGVEHRDSLAGSRAQRFGPPTGVEHGDVRRNRVSAGESQPHAAAGYLEVGDIGGAAQHDTVVNGIAPEPCLQEVLVHVSFIGEVGDVSEMRGSRSSAGARSPAVQRPISLGNHVRTVFSTFELSRARPPRPWPTPDCRCGRATVDKCRVRWRVGHARHIELVIGDRIFVV